MEMQKPDSTSGSGASTVYNTVFIDTSLDTHLAMIVSDSDTVSDLKKKILYEHPLCFPNIGEIKINALKVKRRGYLYHLSDSMFVKSAFGGASRSWFLSLDALSAEEHRENHNSHKPHTGNIVACFDITTNNSSADVVDLLPGGSSKRLSNANDVSLPQDGGDCLAKQSSASQQSGFSNSTKESSENLHMEVEHTADSNSKVLFPATNKESRPEVHLKDVGDDKICEDLPASVAVSVLKEKHKTRKRKKDAIRDHDVKENGALVVESGKDALDSGRSLSSDKNKRSATREKMADEGTKVPGELSECETNKHKDVSLSEQEHKSTENSSQSGTASKKKRKAEKRDGTENSLTKNGVLGSDLFKKGTAPNTATSKSTLDKKLESTSAIVDHLNTEFVKENRLLTACASGGRKKRKKQKSNPTQVGSEISSAKDVHVDTFQAIETINHKDLGSEADREFVLGKISMGGAVSEPCLIPSREMPEGSRTNAVPHSGVTLVGEDDLANTNDNIESQNEAHEPNVVSVLKARDSIDQNASHADGQPAFVSQKEINLQNDIVVSGHENQNGTLEDKIVEPKKSSKKIKKSTKTKDPVGGTEAVNGVHDRGTASDISPAEHPTSVNGDHLSDNAEQDGTTEGKEESKMKKSDCSPSVTDVRVDDVIRDVLESLQQCNSGPENAENMEKKSRKKTKKKSSTVVDPSELLGKDDVDHRNPTIPADNVSEVSASSKSTRKTVKVNSSSAAQLNGSDLGSKNNTGGGISPVHMQLDSSQNTLKANHDRRPIKDVVNVDDPESTWVGNANNSVEVPCESGRVKSQQQHEIVDSGEILIDKESLQQCNNGPANAETMEKKSRKKTKKKSFTVVDPSELQGKDDVDHRDPTVSADTVSEVSASSKSTRKTVKVNSSSAVQLDGSDLGSKNNTGVGISPVHMQLDSSQNTLEANHDRRPIQDVINVDDPKSTRVGNANNSIEVACESERVKSQQWHEIVDSGEKLIDKESLQQCNNGPANAETMEKKSRKKTKKKSSTVVDPSELQGKDDVDHRDPTVPADTVSEVSASSKSTRKTVKVNSSSAAQLDGLDLGSKNNTGVGISPVHMQLDSSQNTLEANHDRRPIQDVVNVDDPKSARVGNANNSIEVACESERVKSQQWHEIVDSGEKLIDKESLQQCNNGPANAENMEKKSRKKTKKKSSTVVDPSELQGKDDVDHRDPTVPADTVSEVSASSKSTRKTVKVNSSSAAQLDGSDLESKNNMGVRISPVHMQLYSSQTIKANHDRRPIQDVVNVGDPKSAHVGNTNNSIEIACESGRVKSQWRHEIVDSGEILIDKESLQQCDNGPANAENMEKKSRKKTKKKNSTVVDPSDLQGKDDVDHRDPTVPADNVSEVSASSKSTRKTVKMNSSSAAELNGSDLLSVETEVKGKMKKEKKPEVQSGGSKPDLLSSEMLNGNQRKEAKAQAAKSSSNVQSRKPLLTISGSVAKEPLLSDKSDKINTIPKDAQRPIDINSSRAHTDLDKNVCAVSGSAVERSKSTINLNKGGNEHRSHLDIAKATGSNNGKVVNSLANKKSLLATAGTIFKHNDKESSDDEDGVDNSDASTRTPSDSSSSSDYSDDSHENVSSSRNGSYKLEGEEAGGRNKQKPGCSSPKRMSLHAILRNSSRYKKAKLTASQDLDSQPDEFVPDSQAT
ncbi:hypothetical protein REPUB_Repub01dG0082000 [Reevesia pubescens]